MSLLTLAMKTVGEQARSILLVALSCAVLAAALMIAFNELDLLQPTEAEELILRWQRTGVSRAAE